MQKEKKEMRHRRCRSRKKKLHTKSTLEMLYKEILEQPGPGSTLLEHLVA